MWIPRQAVLALAIFGGSAILDGGLATAASAQDEACKPVETAPNFDLTDFVSAPWYTHQQAENTFAPPNQSCVKAEYKIRDSPTVPWGYSVDVFNSGRLEDGSLVDAKLCAFQDPPADPEKDASKLKVAPCFLPKAAAGDFWVVAYDQSQGSALIAAGQPTRPGIHGCRTGKGDYSSDSGLWIFSRSPVRDEALIDGLRNQALDAGFDITVLNDVSQEDCDQDSPDVLQGSQTHLRETAM